MFSDKKKLALLLGCCVLILGFSFFIFRLSGLFSSFDRLYSASPYYRLQTNALIAGTFSIIHSPSYLGFDLVWRGDQTQQVWGLAVPLIRLPFDLLFGSFPDRVVLFVWIVFTSIVCFFTFFKLFQNVFKESSFVWNALLSLLVSFCVLSLPAFFGLFHSYFNVYEEAVAYSCFASLLFLYPLLFPPAKKASAFVWAFLVGVSALFRPTLMLYAGTVFLLTFFSVQKRLKYILLVGFVVGVILVSGLNQIRFGSPFEFGHGTNIGPDVLNNYQLKFDYQFKEASFTQASRELLGGLFFTNPKQKRAFFGSGQITGEAPFSRWRDMYFFTFSKPYLLSLVVIFGVFLVSLIFLLKKYIHALSYSALLKKLVDAVGRIPAPLLRGLVFSSISFCLVFLFYLYSPSLASRYVVDFAPAIVCLILFSGITGVYLSRRFWILGFLLTLFLFSNGMSLHHILSFQKTRPNNITKKEVLSKISLLSQTDWKMTRVKEYEFKSDKVNPVSFDKKPYNGLGFFSNGFFKSSAMFYIEDTKQVSLWFTGACSSTLSILEMKVDTAYVKPFLSSDDSGSIQASFKIPEQFHTKLWPVFLRLLPTEQFRETSRKCWVTKIMWR